MQITQAEHEEIVELICEVVNASDPDQDYENPLNYKNLFYKLDELLEKYGDISELINTKAHFTDEVEEQIDLYQRAIALALNEMDGCSLTQAAESLVEIYITDRPDHSKAEEWCVKLDGWMSQYGSEFTISSLADIKARVQRMKISSV